MEYVYVIGTDSEETAAADEEDGHGPDAHEKSRPLNHHTIHQSLIVCAEAPVSGIALRKRPSTSKPNSSCRICLRRNGKPRGDFGAG